MTMNDENFRNVCNPWLDQVFILSTHNCATNVHQSNQDNTFIMCRQTDYVNFFVMMLQQLNRFYTQQDASYAKYQSVA